MYRCSASIDCKCDAVWLPASKCWFETVNATIFAGLLHMPLPYLVCHGTKCKLFRLRTRSHAYLLASYNVMCPPPVPEPVLIIIIPIRNLSKCYECGDDGSGAHMVDDRAERRFTIIILLTINLSWIKSLDVDFHCAHRTRTQCCRRILSRRTLLFARCKFTCDSFVFIKSSAIFAKAQK